MTFSKRLALLGLLAIAGCARHGGDTAGGYGGASGGSTVSRLSAADRAACRNQADTTFGARNREYIYRTDVFAGSIRDAPFATTGLPGDVSRGLSGQYERANLLDDCLRAKAAGAVGNDAGIPAATQPSEISGVSAPSAQPGPAVGVP